jgi:hypothetical protein
MNQTCFSSDSAVWYQTFKRVKEFLNLSFWGGSQNQVLLRGFCHFVGPLGPFGFQGLKIKFYFRGILSLGEPQKPKFYSGTFAHFVGPLEPFGVEGLKIKFYFVGIYPSLGSRTLIYPLVLLPIFGHKNQILQRRLLPNLGAHWGLLWFMGSKSNFSMV